MEFQGYNVTAAVLARHLMLFKDIETVSPEEHADIVWEPVKQALHDMAKTHPSSITCMAGKAYKYPSGGSCVNTYLSTSENQVFYVATVLNKDATLAFRQHLVEIYCHDKAMVHDIRRKQLLAIIRHHTMCAVPVGHDQLDVSALNQGVKKYLRHFVPELHLHILQIKWMPAQEAHALQDYIFTQAEQLGTE